MCSYDKSFCDYKIIHEECINKTEKIVKSLEPFKEIFNNEFNLLLKCTASFKSKTNDFWKDGRKLRIGIMGQVNSGKSCFLNALFFHGENILPEECTPKTKSITIIKNSSENKIEIEYYSINEWMKLRKIHDEKDLSRETFDIIRNGNISLFEEINNKCESIEIKSHEEFIKILDKYTNENNEYLPFIKCIHVYINNEKLKNIEIIDAPGLNDPFISKEYTVKQFLNYADVIFFLSSTSMFLDKFDLELIRNQLPDEGIKKLILLSSKYDSALLDEGWNYEDFNETDKSIKNMLSYKAKMEFEKYDENVYPIYVSSMAENLALKDNNQYIKTESHILNELNNLWSGYEFTKEDLLNTGNFRMVKDELDKVISMKNETLLEKSKDLAVIFENKIKNILYNIKRELEERTDFLEKYDMNIINDEQKMITLKIQEMNKNVDNVIDAVKEKVENKKHELINEINIDLMKICNLELEENTIEGEHKNVKDLKWYNFLFSKNKVEENYEITYKYVNAKKVIENIGFMKNNCCMRITESLNNIIHTEQLKKDLFQGIFKNLDVDNEKFNEKNICLFSVEKHINKIEIEDININIDSYVNLNLLSFKGELIYEDIDEFEIKLQEFKKKFLEMIDDKLPKIIENIYFQLDKAQMYIIKDILSDINNEVKDVKNNYVKKSKEVEFHKEALKVVKSFLR